MKLSKEVLQKIKTIEIHTRRLLSGTQIGDYSSSKKGSGLEFDQIRAYQEGDDVRFIDWKSTARQGTLLVREYVEERSRTVMLVLDGSASTFFSSSGELKSDILTQVAAVLALVADAGKDHVGLILFSDGLELVIPPKAGRQHVRMIMEKMFSHVPVSSSQTSLESSLHRLIEMNRKDAIVFLISDFIVQKGYEKKLRMVSKKYDTVAIRCLDRREKELPFVGVLPIVDPETGVQGFLKTNSKELNYLLEEQYKETEYLLKKCGVDLLEIEIQKPFIGELVRFSRQRMFL